MSTKVQDLLPDVRTIDLGKGLAEVNGIQLCDLLPLLAQNEELLRNIFEKKDTPDFTQLVSAAPEFTMKLMKLGLGVDDEKLIRRIPLVKQIELLMIIWEVAIPDSKTFAAKLLELLEMGRELTLQQTQISP